MEGRRDRRWRELLVAAVMQEVRLPPPTGPAPRLPDGTVDLNGVWNGGACGNFARGLPTQETLPLLPAAKALRVVQNYTHRAPTHMFLLHEGNIHSYRQILENFCQENNQFGIAGGNTNPYLR